MGTQKPKRWAPFLDLFAQSLQNQLHPVEPADNRVLPDTTIPDTVERPHDGIGFNPCLTDEPRHILGVLNYINKDEERPTKDLANEMNEREGVQHQEAEAASINYDCISSIINRRYQADVSHEESTSTTITTA